MRYLITLLVVLSVTVSFGILQYESADTVGAGRFGISVGGTASMALITGVGFGLEYGLFDFLSIGFKGDHIVRHNSGTGSFEGHSFGLNLKGSYDFDGSPFLVSLSLGGEYYDQMRSGWSFVDGVESFVYNYLKGFGAKGSLALQAWFVYVGFSLNESYEPYYVPGFVGLDIEFCDNFSLLLEFGGPIFAGMSLGLEFSF
jgi:hypothetical protein